MILRRRPRFARTILRASAILVAAIVATISASVGASAAAAPQIKIDNGINPGAFRFDTNHNAIDAHDGEIKQFGNTYYLYGTAYGCGYVRFQQPETPFCGFKVYSSTDLQTWRDRGTLFNSATANWQARCSSSTLSCYRPHVLYNPVSRRYVLWINSYDVAGGYHVFTSPSPTGPFVERPLPQLSIDNGGDFDLYLDPSGVAYIAFTDPLGGYQLAVQQLSPDYLSGVGTAVIAGMTNVEAPSMFRRGNIYYMTASDPNCAYCAGTGTSYMTAPTPMGPWAARSKISLDSCGGQPADVAEIQTARGKIYLYQSDRWNHANPNEALGLSYWEPLRFNPDGSIAPLRCAGAYGIALNKGNPDRTLSGRIGAADASGVSWVCDINDVKWRSQTIPVSKPSALRKVRFGAFQRGFPQPVLEASIYRANRRGQPVGTPLWSRQRAVTSWSPEQITFAPHLRLRPAKYAFVLKSLTPGPGCLGTLRLLQSHGGPTQSFMSRDAAGHWQSAGKRNMFLDVTLRGR